MITVLSIAGTVVLAISGSIYSFTHYKTYSIWVFFVALVIYAFAFCWFLQSQVAKSSELKKPKFSEQVENYKKLSDHPKIVINSQNKPFLRYQTLENGKISFSYELSFKNKGKNSAINLEFLKIVQKLVIENSTVVQVQSGENEEKTTLKAGYRAPNLLVSDEVFYQIFNLNSPNLNNNQLNNLVKKYNDAKLSVIVEIKLSYKDEITNTTYLTHEILDIHKNKVLILK